MSETVANEKATQWRHCSMLLASCCRLATPCPASRIHASQSTRTWQTMHKTYQVLCLLHVSSHQSLSPPIEYYSIE
jgi:hypothetical protein